MSVYKLVHTINKKEKRPNPIRYGDILLYGSTILLALFGCIMIVSATMGTAAGSFSVLIKTILKQIIFIVGGFIGMFAINAMFKLKLLDNSNFLTALIVMMFVMLVLPLGFTDSNGAHAWIPLGVMTIQPSEFAKLGIILLVASYMGNKGKVPMKAFKTMYWTLFVLVILFVGIVVFLQGDFGSGMVMFCIAAICLFVPSTRRLDNIQHTMRVAVALGTVAVVVILFLPIGEKIIDMFVFLKDYQKARIFSARNPFADQFGTGYQLINGLVAFASGGFMGQGFGNSVRKFTNFPAANTDYILSIIVEETGFFGFICVFTFYTVIIYRLFKYALLIKNEKARIILVGMAAYFFIHFLFNVGGVTGLIPLTGVPLLLLSSGGSSAASVLLGIGFAQAVISQYKMGEIK